MEPASFGATFTRRQEQRLKLFQFDAPTVEALRRFRPVLDTHIDDVLDDFFAFLTKRPDLVQLSPEATAAARERLRRHWLEAVFDAAVPAATARRIAAAGQTHEWGGLEPAQYVSAYCFALNRFSRLVLKACHDDPQAAVSIMEAVNKAAFLDLSLAISTGFEAVDDIPGLGEVLSREELDALLLDR